jgi:HTH-type transcriptional regulator/antitoxin MqsA
MAKTPRNYPETLLSPESGRPMRRGEKLVTFDVDGRVFRYRQPGWWCSLDDPDDLDGQLVDEDNLVAEMARRTARAMVDGKVFTPLAIRAIRLRCGLTQVEAGRAFGTGEKSFEKYESGEISPSGPTLRLLKLAMERPALFAKRKSPRPASTGGETALVRKTIKEAKLDRLYGPLFTSRQVSSSKRRRADVGS